MEFYENLLGQRESAFSRVCGTIVNCLLALLVVALIAVLVVTNMFALCEIDGTSMNPTLQTKQYVLVEKHKSTIERGDIVVFKKEGATIQLIKRTMAVGGDTFIFVRDGSTVELSVNGEEVENDFEMSASTWTRYSQHMTFALGTEYTVPDGKLMVLGDNRDNSTDSRFREVGFVDLQTELVGRADVFITPGSFTELVVKLAYGAPLRESE